MLSRRQLSLAVVMTLAVFVGAWVGMAAPVAKTITPWWPPAGIGLAGLFLLGWRFWPTIMVGCVAFHVSFGLQCPFLISWLALVNTSEALLGCWLLKSLADFRSTLDRWRDVGQFVLVAVVSSGYSTALGVPAFLVSGLATDQPVGDLLLRWWLGNMTGKLVIGTLVFTWARPEAFRSQLRSWSVILITTAALSFLVFTTRGALSSPYWLFPLVIWAAVRQGRRGVTAVAALVTLIAVAFTVHEFGPYAIFGASLGTMRLQVFIGVLAIAGLALAAAFYDRSQALAELSQREHLFRSLLENGQEVYCLLDQHGRITFITPNCAQVMGMTPAEFIGTRIIDHIHPDDQERNLHTLAGLVAQPGDTASALTLMKHTTLGYRWMEGTGTNLLHHPDIGAIVVNFRDVTDRKNAQDAVRASEASLTAAQRVAGVGSWERDLVSITDLTSNPLRWSDQTYRIFGYEPQSVAVTGDMFYQAVHPDDRPAVQAAIAQALQNKREYSIEHRIRRPDGTERIVHERCDVVCDLNGRPTKLLGTVQDITERKAAEARLIVQDERIRMLVKASPLAVIVFDRGGIVRVWNPAAEQRLGWTADSMIGQPNPLTTPDQPGAWAELQAKALADGSVTGKELKCLRRDGRAVWFNVSVAPLRDATGAITGALWLLDDVTEPRQLREQLGQSQKMESIGRLAGGIAHDFNNLLTIINGYSDLALERLAPMDPARELIREIRRAGQRAAGLTSQLLAFGRKSMVAPVPLNLNSVLAELQKMLRRLIGEDIEMTTILDPAVGPVRIDPTQMEQIIMNLAVNARDAMPTGGQMVIETRNVDVERPYPDTNVAVAPGHYVLLAVTDNGLGMAEDVRARIFEPFFTTKELGHGTGLGLATVYGIVKQNNGHIAVYSEIGRGTTFKVYLPRVDGPVADDTTTIAPAPHSHGGRETILLVEDEESVRKLARTILESAGYRVLEARDGQAAQDLATTAPGAVQLLLTDVVMPRLSEPELVRQLRQQQPQLRVVYMSGYTDHVMFRQGAVENSDRFVQKPFTARGLLEKIREALDESKSFEK